MLAAPKVRRAGEVDRGPAREPARRRASRATSTATCRMAFDADGTILAAHIDFVSGLRRVPDAVAGRRPRPRSAMLFPGPYRVPTAELHDASRSTRTPSGAPRTAGRGSSRRSPARCCSTSRRGRWASTRSSCAAATCCAATSCRTPTPNGMTVRQHHAARDVRAGARDARLRRVPRASRPRRAPTAATSASASSQLRRADDARLSGTTAPRARRSASSRRARSTCTSPAARPATASRRPSCSSPPTRSASTSTTSTRSRATPRSPASAPAPAGAAAASMTAGAVGETRGDPARAHRRASPPTSSRPRPTTSSSPTSRASVRGTPAIGVSLAEIADDRVLRARRRCRPDVPAGLEASAPLHARERRSIWANATHVCTCEVDVATGQVDAAALHRERGLRPDDQPQRRRGPDRRRHRAGHRRRAATSTSPTTTTATRSPPRSWTTCCRPRPRCPTIEYGHIETPSPGPGGYKGVGEGGAIGAPPAVVNAVADALAPFGVTVTRLPLSPSDIVDAPRGRRPLSSEVRFSSRQDDAD